MELTRVLYLWTFITVVVISSVNLQKPPQASTDEGINRTSVEMTALEYIYKEYESLHRTVLEWEKIVINEESKFNRISNKYRKSIEKFESIGKLLLDFEDECNCTRALAWNETKDKISRDCAGLVSSWCGRFPQKELVDTDKLAEIYLSNEVPDFVSIFHLPLRLHLKYDAFKTATEIRNRSLRKVEDQAKIFEELIKDLRNFINASSKSLETVKQLLSFSNVSTGFLEDNQIYTTRYGDFNIKRITKYTIDTSRLAASSQRNFDRNFCWVSPLETAKNCMKYSSWGFSGFFMQRCPALYYKRSNEMVNKLKKSGREYKKIPIPNYNHFLEKMYKNMKKIHWVTRQIPVVNEEKLLRIDRVVTSEKNQDHFVYYVSSPLFESSNQIESTNDEISRRVAEMIIDNLEERSKPENK